VKITPAHDFNDFDVGQRQKLEQINIFTTRGEINDNAPEKYRGLDRFEARKAVLADLEAAGVLDHVEDKKIMVPHDEKSKLVVIEPYLTDQWWVKAEVLAQKAKAAVREGRTRFVPQQYENTYFAWMDNIKPWCVSRQLWWGHQIPAWYGPNSEVFVAGSEAEAQAMAGEGVPLRRDEDVLDTWFSSALWPFSTLGWPDDTPELRRYYPTSVLVTGFDIIFFWVARMMMMGLEFMGKEPFHTVYMHALVRDERGAKMSKTKGNVIDPLELVDGYGADSTRFTLAAMAAQGRDLKLSMNRVEGYRNFVTKLWNAARFLEINECHRVEGYDPKSPELALNRWIVGATARAVAEVTRTLDEFKFNEAANTGYDFVWGTFCDWYVELAKPVLTGEDEAQKAETRATAAWALDQILKLLHPFMPFVTEELWAETGKNGPARDRLLILTEWPDLDGLGDPDADAELDRTIELISGIRSVRTEMNVPPAAKVPLVVVGASDATRQRLERQLSAIQRLARIDAVTHASEVPSGSAQIVLGEATFALPLAGIIDLDVEKARLSKDMAKEADEIDKIGKKLGNEQFVSRAPEEVIEEQRDRLAAAKDRRDRIAAALARLS
jgi:valyl-tRNA synthetase